MKEIAIIGATASGKTGLSIDMAHKTNSIILSLDSLSVYKEIDIASAKPTLKERDGIIHFGIDEVFVNESFDVVEFLQCYKKAKEFARQKGKNLIIVGGTGFYLKILIEGISEGVGEDVKLDMPHEDIYKMLFELDKTYMEKIASNDKYRIQKAYSIYKKSGLTPSQYFIENPKKPMSPELKLFEIYWDREELKKRIALRTKQMIQDGVIDEVLFLENKYTRKPNAMSAIGIIETLEFIDGKLTKEQLEEKISLNTAKLAKRQNTFNKSQFNQKQETNIIENLNSDILKYFTV
ncbi:tRNA (adenosine(37)-N6)-dimethylallyltransferase MiaA [Arcobacter sp. KX21116]|uniref:tRNA (adenosine(37)-N6)-dimethylallyltransferase MiaA n=1 Tax=Arcobacter iocasae TaxID=2906515 RepID=UPI0035D47AF3